ncbi:hypothetical protein PG990_010480 [Apiospora arundinis]
MSEPLQDQRPQPWKLMNDETPHAAKASTVESNEIAMWDNDHFTSNQNTSNIVAHIENDVKITGRIEVLEQTSADFLHIYLFDLLLALELGVFKRAGAFDYGEPIPLEFTPGNISSPVVEFMGNTERLL